MTATLQDIEYWLAIAEKKSVTHLIVAVDRYNNSNYPVYVPKGVDVKEEITRIESQSLQGVDEVYKMSMNIQEQLSKKRVYNL